MEYFSLGVPRKAVYFPTPALILYQLFLYLAYLQPKSSLFGDWEWTSRTVLIGK